LEARAIDSQRSTFWTHPQKLGILPRSTRVRCRYSALRDDQRVLSTAEGKPHHSPRQARRSIRSRRPANDCPARRLRSHLATSTCADHMGARLTRCVKQVSCFPGRQGSSDWFGSWWVCWASVFLGSHTIGVRKEGRRGRDEGRVCQARTGTDRSRG
jgi:hypothetical protein